MELAEFYIPFCAILYLAVSLTLATWLGTWLLGINTWDFIYSLPSPKMIKCKTFRSNCYI